MSVSLPNVTILVGPNNSGKSETLREIEVWSQGKNPVFRVLEDVELFWPDDYGELLSVLKQRETLTPNGQQEEVGKFWVGRPAIRSGEGDLHYQVDENTLQSCYDNRANPKQMRNLRGMFLKALTLRLDGITRFDLVAPKPTGPLESAPQNHLWALFNDDYSRKKVRNFTDAAFGKYFVIDPTGMTNFRIRLSARAPISDAEEQGLDAASRKFHGDAPLIEAHGDGVKTSVGLVSATLSLPHQLLLIDEPEAFLHPTLARRVGTTLAEAAIERDASLIVATHSSDIVMGCINATTSLRIVRLTYQGGIATARSIEQSQITTLMKDPLLRSANAMRALFHGAVVVTEGDTDRAFYEEINFRKLQQKSGIDDALFMNAQNWQTIPRIVTPLRKLGIPAAAVFDFDVLMDDDFSKVWPLLNIGGDKLINLQTSRESLSNAMNTVGREQCKESGLNALSSDVANNARQLLGEFRKFGVFFVDVGELERWLPELQVASQKKYWLTEIFEKLGSDPSDPDYFMPKSNDVWGFIEIIKTWIENPNREGLPD